MTKQEIHSAWFPNPPTYNRIGSRRFRRLLVVGTYGGWLVLAVILKMVTPSDESFPLIPVVLLANALALLPWFARKTYISREVLAGDMGLDERLVQNRNQAFRGAFRVFVGIVLIGWPLSSTAISLYPDSQGLNIAFLIYAGAVMLGTTLPTVIWAWREPDPVEPEELPA